MKSTPFLMIRRRLLWLVSLLVLALLVLALLPRSTAGLAAQPDPADNYAAAIQRFARLQARDTSAINPDCRSQLLTHDQAVEQVVVLFHGMSTCPQQFMPFAEELHAHGYNVLVPRMPHNGLIDRSAASMPELRAEDLQVFADDSIDIAAGLGEHLSVAGLSAGGVLAAWSGQFRPEVDHAVLLSPAFGLGRWPSMLNYPMLNLLNRLPNIYTAVGQGNPANEPDYVYHRHSSRAIAEVTRLGRAIAADAARRPPQAESLLLLVNENDRVIDNQEARKVLMLWQAYDSVEAREYVLGPEYTVGHDLIDPGQPDQQTELIYRLLHELIAE
jgi:carboxylesterase